MPGLIRGLTKCFLAPWQWRTIDTHYTKKYIYIYYTVNYILLCKHTLKHISRNVDVSWGEESDQFKAFSLGDKWNKAQEKKA